MDKENPLWQENDSVQGAVGGLPPLRPLMLQTLTIYVLNVLARSCYAIATQPRLTLVNPDEIVPMDAVSLFLKKGIVLVIAYTKRRNN